VKPSALIKECEAAIEELKFLMANLATVTEEQLAAAGRQLERITRQLKLTAKERS